MKKLLAAAAVVMLLSGCAQAGNTNAAEKDSAGQQEAASAESLLESQTSYCADLSETLTPYAEFASGMLEEKPMETGEWLNLHVALTGLDPSGLGPKWEDDHANYMSIHDQIEDAVNNGDAGITLDSTDYKAGVLAVMDNCVSIGYTMAD